MDFSIGRKNQSYPQQKANKPVFGNNGEEILNELQKYTGGTLPDTFITDASKKVSQTLFPQEAMLRRTKAATKEVAQETVSRRLITATKDILLRVKEALGAASKNPEISVNALTPDNYSKYTKDVKGVVHLADLPEDSQTPVVRILTSEGKVVSGKWVSGINRNGKFVPDSEVSQESVSMLIPTTNRSDIFVINNPRIERARQLKELEKHFPG